MNGRGTCRAVALAAAFAACPAAARADDPPPDAPSTPDAEKPKVEGDARVGWRFLSGEGEGRFQQDVGLKDGLRLFDFNALATGLRGSTPFDEAQAHVDGAGDRESDYLMSVRRRDLLDVSGGYRRDDSVYSASGDIFPMDTLRERGFVHALLTPSHALSVRLTWDRNGTVGDTNDGAYSDILPTPPNSIDKQALPQHERFTRLFDDFAAGADYATGAFRFGLTQTVRLGQTDADSSIHVTRSGEALHDDVDQSTRMKAYATTGKAGVVLLDGKLDATLFVTNIDSPLKARAAGDTRSLSNGAAQPGSFHTDSELRRNDLVWRLESSWRPHKDWEFTAAAERGDDVTDESVDLWGRNYPIPPKPTDKGSTAQYRITDRTRRFSGDVTWDATERLRLRAGEQYLYEDLYDGTNSHFNEVDHATDFSSASWRTTLGADWTNPGKAWSVGALAHHTTNDTPQTTAIPDYGDDWSLRGRWRNPSKELTLTGLWKHSAATHTGAVDLTTLGAAPDSTNFGSATRADSVSGTAAWTHAPWTVSGTATYRTFDTSADTAYALYVNGGLTGRKVFDKTTFSGRDTVANVDVRYEFTKTLRVFTDLTGTDASGDYDARWLQLSLGGEHDLRKDLTLGVTLSTWRLDQDPSGGDNYRTYGAEVSLTYRF